MDTSSALTQSMQNITQTKLAALSEQQQDYESKKRRIVDAVSKKHSVAEAVELLLYAFDKEKIMFPQDVSASNIRRLVERSRHDPAVTTGLLQTSNAALEQALDVPSRRFEHASLFGHLVTEWLSSTVESTSSTRVGSEASDPFEHVGRKEMYEQRREWESIVFAEDSKSDPTAVEAYLADLFGSTSKAKKLVKTPIELLNETMKAFNVDHFDIPSLKLCMTGVLKTDLLSEAKRKTLAEFLNNPMLLQEMVDVLNMQIDGLETWSWGVDAVPVEVRRALNGKYRVYMDEEILQALFLHYVGLKFATHLKLAFLTFFQSGAWKQASRNSLNRQARRTRLDFLGRGQREERGTRGRRWEDSRSPERQEDQNVRNERRKRYQKDYFMLQLPASFESMSDNYDGSGSSDKGAKAISPMAVKQALLHLITTEALVNTRVYGSFTILQSDFKWFGPSMPHATIMAVLHFFGVSDKWLKFFEKFLEAPIKFAQDGPQAQTQIRRSGVPIQHRLSDALGEAVLFCLDFAVNKATESNLYRLHDDIWFWGAKDATVKAWETVQEFASVTGLRLNHGKTGAVELSGDPISAREIQPSDALPSGPITWGFLKMGKSGKWVIDDQQVESHVEELRLQLQSCKSVFAWVQAWNVYVGRFLSNNFGAQANCLGRPHLDMVIEVFGKMQRKLFAAKDMEGDNVVAHLRQKLMARFDVTEVPDGFFYFPTELGGLGLVDPLIPLFLSHKYSLANPVDLIDKAFELEQQDYAKDKKAFLNGTSHSRLPQRSQGHEAFMNLDEYTSYREETSVRLFKAYKELLEEPPQSNPERTAEMIGAHRAVFDELNNAFRSPYYEEVFQLYGPEILRKYGGLAMGEKRLLPIGLVSMLQSEKVRWQS